MLVLPISLRPIEPGDEEVLFSVYASTREDEMALVPWSDAEKEAFLRSQFHAQHMHYRAHYPEASYQLILREGIAIGRLYVDRWPTEIRIMDIALLPAQRRCGIGRMLLEELMAEARTAGKSLSLHVEQNNPAYGLYTKLGFRKIGDASIYDLLEWRDSQVAR